MHPNQPHVPHEPAVSVRTYWLVFAALMVLLLLTVGATRIEEGVLSIATAIAIAVVKALLILLFFMHVKYSSRLIWLFAGASFLWFGIMLLFVFADMLTRPILPTLGK
jgi:cytochrome c oxidase subunit IV